MGKDSKIIKPGAPDEPEKPAKPAKPPARSDTGNSTDPVYHQDPQPKESKPPILIIPLGGHLGIASDDPAVQQMIEKLVDLITANSDNDEFAVIHLKNTRAVEVARVLDEMYNGPRMTPQQQQQLQQQQQQLQQQFLQQQQQGQPMTQQPQQPQQPSTHSSSHKGSSYGSSSTGHSSSHSSSYTKTDRVRIVADENTNALLVRAAPIDMLTIRSLVRNSLDVVDTDSKVALKSHLLPLKWANAHEVAAILTSIYREQMNVTPLPGQRGAVAALAAQANGGNPNAGRPTDANGNPRPVGLTIGVDERTNALALQCSDLLLETIKPFVEDLDKAAKDTRMTVKIRPVRGIDPALVQRVVDGIQGHRTLLTAPPPPAPPPGGPGNGGGPPAGIGQGGGAPTPPAGGRGLRPQ